MKALAVFSKDRYRSIDALVADLYTEDNSEIDTTTMTKPTQKRTNDKRNTTINRKSTAEDLKNRLKEKGTKLPSQEKKEEEKPSSTRYKKVERKYGKDFAETLSNKINKK